MEVKSRPAGLRSLLGWALALAVLVAHGQDPQPATPAVTPQPTPLRTANSTEPKPGPNELEAKFKARLTKSTWTGRWCTIKDGKLTPEQEDKYTIVSVTKLVGETWLINARIQYGQKDFVAPIPVLVKWAGDTPVITLDNVGFPGGTTYSARVLVHGNTYAGTWSGGDHAGLLSGIITNE